MKVLCLVLILLLVQIAWLSRAVRLNSNTPRGYRPSRSLYQRDLSGVASEVIAREKRTDLMSSAVDSNGRSQVRNQHSGIVRVITDIDDTVKSSGGKTLLGIPLGGIDKQYRRGEFYPGVFQFIFELSRHGAAAASKGLQEIVPETVGVLTARAKEFKFALELKQEGKLCSKFRDCGVKNGFHNWGVGSVYYGSAQEWVVNSWKGLRKFENFELMMEDHAREKEGKRDEYIFVGDTGERDEQAGEFIAARYPRNLRAVFLHVVSMNTDPLQVHVPKDRYVGKVPIYYFRTYVGAATKAVKAGLMSVEGLQNVVDQATVDYALKDDKNMAVPHVLTELESDMKGARAAISTIKQEEMYREMRARRGNVVSTSSSLD